MVAAYGLLSLIYYVSFIRVKNKDPPHIAELKREIAIWKRTAERLNVVSLEERAVRDAILAKADDVQNQLNQEATSSMHSSKDMWQKNLAELESKYRITNWVLLIKSSSVLVVVIFMFFMSHTLPSVELHLGLSMPGWLTSRDSVSSFLHVVFYSRMDRYFWGNSFADPLRYPGSGVHLAQDRMGDTPLFCWSLRFDGGVSLCYLELPYCTMTE